MSRKKYILPIVMLFILLLTGCTNNSKKNLITTTVNTYNEPVKSIVGDRFEVESIIKSVNVDPHSFAPSTNNSKQIADSKLIVANGLGYDDWVNKMVAANSQQKNLIDFGHDVLHYPNGSNEHIWFGVEHMKKLSKAIYQHMARVDVNSKNYYYGNYKKYLKKLDKLSAREQSIKKYSQGKVAYVTEPLPDYLLQDLGVKVADTHFAKAIEDDTDPSIKDVNDMQNGMREHKVDFIVVNKQVSSSIITKMTNTAKKYNIPIIYFTETLPTNLGYYEWMSGNLNQIERVVKE